MLTIIYTLDHPFPVTAMSESTPIIPLSAAQKEVWLDAASELAQAPLSPGSTDGNNPHRRTYVVAFDGTWNDRAHVKPGESPTNPAQLEAELSQHYNGTTLTGRYYRGVGTQENALMVKLDGATGFSAGQIAEQAYHDFERTAKAWITADPQAEIGLVIVGFSRGSASARHFMNLVDERGVPASELADLGLARISSGTTPSDYLRQPGTLSQDALLYDTVATGQEHFLKLGIPDSVRNVVHLTALDEERVAFPLLSAKSTSGPVNSPQVLEVGLPGAHSDIGGGYSRGPDRMAKYMGEVVLSRFGLPITPGEPPVAALDEGVHDSQWQADRVLKPLEEVVHGPGREVKTVTPPSPMESLVQAITEQAQRVSVVGIPAITAFAGHVQQEDVGTVEISHDRNGTVRVLSSLPDTHLDLPRGLLKIGGDILKLDPEDLSAITHGNGIVFHFGREQALGGSSRNREDEPTAQATGVGYGRSR